MDTVVLTNMLTGNVGVLSQGGQSVAKSSPSAAKAQDNPAATECPEATTPESPVKNPKNEPSQAERPPDSFEQALNKEMAKAKAEKDSPNPNGQSKTSKPKNDASAETAKNQLQDLLGQKLPLPVVVKADSAAVNSPPASNLQVGAGEPVSPKVAKTQVPTGAKEPPAAPKTTNLPVSVAGSGEPKTEKPAQTLPTTQTQPLTKQPSQTTADAKQGQPADVPTDAAKAVHAPDGSVPAKGEAEVTVQVAGKTPAAAQDPAGEQAGIKSVPETTDMSNKTETSGKKPPTADPISTPPNSPKPTSAPNAPTIQENLLTQPQKELGGFEKPVAADTKPMAGKNGGLEQARIHNPSQPDGETPRSNPNSASKPPALTGLDLAELQISTNQGKSLNSFKFDGNPKSTNSEQTPPAGNAQVSAPQQTNVSAPAAKANGNTFRDAVSESISEQIRESVMSSTQPGRQQITVRLYPPELGKVVIKFDQRQDEIVGLLEVTKAETRVQIQQALPQIVRNLADSGVHVKRLEVVLANEQQQAYKDQSLADGQGDWAGRQGWTNSGTDSNDSYNAWADEMLSSSNGSAWFAETGQVLITDKSINVLA